MRTPEQKFQMIREQVISKVHWGARRPEVIDWLQEKHGIVGADAEKLLTEADCARSKAIRGRAMIRLICSIIGIALVGAYFYIRYFCGFIFYGGLAITSTALVFVVGATSISTLFSSTAKLITGKAQGSVD